VAGETAGNTIGKIEFYTADTDGPRVGAYIKTTSQDTFGRLNHLHFAVSRSVNAAATEVMRVTADGLTFNGDTAAANALDDYEEGTWTPTLLGTTTNPTQSYMYQFGYYTKIGDTVHFQLRIYLQGAGITPGSGSVYIAGLPFDIASGAGYGSTAAITASNWQTTNLGAPTQARPIQNTDTINLYVYNNDAGKLMSPTIANAGDCDDHCAVIISGHYRT
jgi:hypothetical protein